MAGTINTQKNSAKSNQDGVTDSKQLTQKHLSRKSRVLGYLV
jgi:hypothetical protein